VTPTRDRVGRAVLGAAAQLRGREFRGKGSIARLAARAFPPPGEDVSLTYPQGYALRVPWGRTAEQMAFGLYERIELQFLRSTLRPGDVFIDVGANVGFYSCLAAARCAPGGLVIAVEPYADSAARLRENLSRVRESARTEVFEVAALDGVAEFTLYVPDAAGSASGASGIVQHDARAVRVPAATLDSILDRSDALPAGARFLKIDVEGYETDVLAGARQTLETVRYVLIEINRPLLEARGITPADVTGALTNAGFRHSREMSRDPGPAPAYSNHLFMR
jgi:FkbM family methyltransferase